LSRTRFRRGMRAAEKMVPEAILIGDHGLSCLLAEKLSLRDLRLLLPTR
jgi:hypothetical protein